MPKVLNKYHGDYSNAVWIMRPSIWGNPFKIGLDGTREEVVEKYRNWLLTQPALVAEAKTTLRGKDLVCCCAPKLCHGDVLLEIVNET